MATHLGGGGEVQGAALAVQAHRHPKLTGQSGSPRTAVTWPALELKITPQPTPQYGQVERVSVTAKTSPLRLLDHRVVLTQPRRHGSACTISVAQRRKPGIRSSAAFGNRLFHLTHSIGIGWIGKLPSGVLACILGTEGRSRTVAHQRKVRSRPTGQQGTLACPPNSRRRGTHLISTSIRSEPGRASPPDSCMS